ncbi:MAG: hypothetical protein VX205_00185 [Pseudomonadota bacterium]|nr:hypothetical protein [Pseudomonadota bacterium]MEC8033394.1 hypothetical protein [Pseudomonadota bacterium]
MNVTPLRPSTMPPRPAVITRTERVTARIALYAAALLRNVDAVALHDLGIALATAAAHDCIPRYSDNSHLVRIMQDLGWQKDGYAGAGATRSPLYRRARPARPLS